MKRGYMKSIRSQLAMWHITGVFVLTMSGCVNINSRNERKIYLARATIEVNQGSDQAAQSIWAANKDQGLPKGTVSVVSSKISRPTAASNAQDGSVSVNVNLDSQSTRKPNDGDLIELDSQVWQAELERELIKRGYVVLSDVPGQSNKSVATPNYIVQINALEFKPRTLNGGDVTVTINHFETNEDGSNPLRTTGLDQRTSFIDEERGKTLMAIIEEHFMPVFCSVFLDAKIIEGESRQVINSYRLRRDVVLYHRPTVEVYFPPWGRMLPDIIAPRSPKANKETVIVQRMTVPIKSVDGVRNRILEDVVRNVCSEYIETITSKP
jgi:hypothetical protein